MSKLVQISSQVRIRFGSTRPNCSPKKYGNKINKIKKLKNSSINYRYIPKIMHFSFSLVQASKLFNYTFLLKAISIEYKVTRQCRKRQDHDAIKQDFGYKTMGLHIISSFRAEWRITEHDWKSRSYEKKIKIRSHTRARTHTDIYDCQIMLQLRPLLLGLQVSLRVGGITLFFVLNLGIIPVFIASWSYLFRHCLVTWYSMLIAFNNNVQLNNFDVCTTRNEECMIFGIY